MGIFGKQRQQQPQYGGTVNNGMGNTWGVTPDMVLEKAIDPQPKRGGMFGGVGTLRGIAGVIGDALLQSSGSRPVFAPAMMQRQQAEAEARQAEAQRRASLEDYRTKKQIDSEFAGPEWGYEQDNAGNMWRYDKRSGKFEDKPVFIDRAERQTIVDGQIVRVPNPFGGQQQAGPQPGTVVDGFRFKGGNPNDRNSWEPVSAAPQQPFTREQYQGLVNVFGESGAQAYLKRNGMTVGGY